MKLTNQPCPACGYPKCLACGRPAEEWMHVGTPGDPNSGHIPIYHVIHDSAQPNILSLDDRLFVASEGVCAGCWRWLLDVRKAWQRKMWVID